jgi:hypothetical protein
MNSLMCLLFQSKVIVYCQSTVPGPYRVAAIKWYSGSRGYFEPSCATLAICFTNGRCQLMQSDLDNGMNASYRKFSVDFMHAFDM